MYVALFNVAGWAIVAWLLLIFLPKWRVTRFLARTEVFPVLLAALYVAGVVPLLLETGPGVMRDFGSAEGVTRLLARQDVALVAWIHILCFDQLVGLYIYRDNMERRHVPLVVQSVLLFLTLMFGPAGFLLYYLLRLVRRKRPADGSELRVSSSELKEGREVEPRDAEAVTRRAAPDDRGAELETRNPKPGSALSSAYAEERALMWTGALGVVLGALLMAWVAARGRYVPPEGDLYKAATFDIAIGLYTLTVALFAPYAGFTPRGRRVWRWSLVGLVLYCYAVETGQIMRGLNPRFTRAGGPVDIILGAVLGLAALGLIASFIILVWRSFTRRAAVRDALVLTGLRYAFASAMVGFAAGLWLGANTGARVGETGNLLPLHAAGFHALQAVPLVALLFARARTPRATARRWVHAAGLAWLFACLALAWQTAAGRSVLEPAPASLLAGLLFLVWAASAVRATLAWRRKAPLNVAETAASAA